MDIYSLFHLWRFFKFISKTSNFLIPIIGWSMYLTGHVGLKRTDKRSQLQVKAQGSEKAGHGTTAPLLHRCNRGAATRKRREALGAAVRMEPCLWLYIGTLEAWISGRFPQVLKDCRTLLQRGCSLLFFPEGTRSRTGQMREFKKGAFSIASKVRAERGHAAP